MSKIVLAPYGSLGDLHPFLAMAIELRDRGHEIRISTLEPYREKIAMLGFDFSPLRPAFDPEDREVARQVMDTKDGSEKLITEYLLPAMADMYSDLLEASKGADVLVAGEIVFASHSVAEKLGLKLVTTTLAPLSMFSEYEPNIFPNVRFLKYLNFLGRPFQKAVLGVMNRIIYGWLESYRAFRVSIDLSPEHDPILRDKFSKDLHLAMFSKVLGRTQPDWKSNTLQTGFCFYDGQKDMGNMPQELKEFLNNGSAPIVFTLGSAAVMDPRDFFEESIKAAKALGKRAVFLYGIFNESPSGLDEDRVGFEYAPYSQLFPYASCVVHQAGVGTTAQVMRAASPHLIVPFSHDQPDNAERCERIGVAEIIDRDSYNAETAVKALKKIFSTDAYKAKALEQKRIIDSENGTSMACDAIEALIGTKRLC
jgi:UDP:flavonoid glycosyltransferase YjiC (YdhE family)